VRYLTIAFGTSGVGACAIASRRVHGLANPAVELS
jgi:hypothetical protein